MLTGTRSQPPSRRRATDTPVGRELADNTRRRIQLTGRSSPSRSPRGCSRSPTRRVASARRPPRSTSLRRWPSPDSRHSSSTSTPRATPAPRWASTTTPRCRPSTTCSSTARRCSTSCSRARRSRTSSAPRPRSTWPARRSSSSRSSPASRGCRRRSRPRPERSRVRLHPHRLPAQPRPAHRQRHGRGERGVHPDPVRVLRARGPLAAAQEHRPGQAAPQPDAARVDHPADDVRRAHPPLGAGRRRGA